MALNSFLKMKTKFTILEFSAKLVTGNLLFFSKRANTGLFSVYFLVFSNKQYNSYNKSMWKMYIQYTALGSEPMTFQTWVVTHNH